MNGFILIFFFIFILATYANVFFFKDVKMKSS